MVTSVELTQSDLALFDGYERDNRRSPPASAAATTTTTTAAEMGTASATAAR
jgi:hypothetical protein